MWQTVFTQYDPSESWYTEQDVWPDDTKTFYHRASAAFIAETNQVMWSLLTNTILHGRTIVYRVTPATEANMMTVGNFTQICGPGRNGSQLTDDSVTRLKDEFASKDPNVILSYDSFLDDDMERLVEMCPLEMCL